MKTLWSVGMVAVVLCNTSMAAPGPKASPKTQYAEVVLDVQGMT